MTAARCQGCNSPQSAHPCHCAASATLTASGTAPAKARHWVRHALHSCGAPAATVDDAALCINELTANAISHSGTPTVDIHVETTGAVIHLDVVDHGHNAGQAPDAGPMPDADAEHGRGMPIVAALADAIQVHRHPDGGTHVHITFITDTSPQGDPVAARRLSGQNDRCRARVGQG
ncbi:ATP-binding protein [Streptomyces chartreusis]